MEEVKGGWVIEAFIKSLNWKDDVLRIEFISSRTGSGVLPIVGEFVKRIIHTFHPGYNLDTLFSELSYAQKLAVEEFTKVILPRRGEAE